MSETIRVLHVDDEPEFVELAADALPREGPFEVTTETDPAAALERFEDGRFDAVVSDYEMPGQTGVELLETVTTRYPDVPCIMFTGKGSEAVASEAIAAGATDYLQKEPGLEQFTLLANRLENAVDQARTTRKLRREKHRRDRILEATPMGIVVHDRRGAVTLVNERARDILDASTEEMDAGNYPDVPWRLRNHDGTPVDPSSLPFSRVRASDAPIHDVPYVLERADGTTQDIVVHGAPIRNDDGRWAGAVVVFGTA